MATETIERPRTGGPASGLGGNWLVIVLNDDHNTFDHVARTLARVIPGVTVQRGHEIANVIHTSGRAIVYSGQQEPAAKRARARGGPADRQPGDHAAPPPPRRPPGHRRRHKSTHHAAPPCTRNKRVNCSLILPNRVE